MALKQTQLKGRDVGDGSIGRADLNVTLAGDAVLRKMTDVASSGVKISSYTGVDPGTGDVGMILDWTLLDTRWGTSNWAKNALKPTYTTSEIPEAATPVNLYYTETRVDANAKVVTAYNHSQAVHDKTFVGLNLVDNTADANKSVSYANSTKLVTPLANYVWNAASLPLTYEYGIQHSFVQGSDGFPSYGSVVNIKSYSGGGGTLQIYTPYAPSYGGNTLKVRFGNYDVDAGNAWTAWKALWHDGNFTPSNYFPVTGGLINKPASLVDGAPFGINDKIIIYPSNFGTANNWYVNMNVSGSGFTISRDYDGHISGNQQLPLNVNGWTSVIVNTPLTVNSNALITGSAEIRGGAAMSGGWNRTLQLSDAFPGIVFSSGSGSKFAAINYDYSSNFIIRVGATSADVFADGVSALSINAINGAATFISSVTAKSLSIGQQTNGTVSIDAYGSFAYFGCNGAENGMKIGADGAATFKAQINVKNTNTAIDSDGSNLYLKSAGVVYLNTACTAYVNNNGTIGNNTGNSTQWQEGYANSRKFNLATFSYDAGNMHFYWNKIARIESGYNHLNINVLVQQNMDSAASMGIFNINVTRSGAGRTRITNAPIVFDPWGGNSIVECCIDSNYDIWIRSTVSWAPSLKYILLDNIGCTIYEGSAITSQEAQPAPVIVYPNETKSFNTFFALEAVNIFGLVQYGAFFGINTTSPSEKFHVNGNIRSEGNVYAATNLHLNAGYFWINKGTGDGHIVFQVSGANKWQQIVSNGGDMQFFNYARNGYDVIFSASGNASFAGAVTAAGGGFNSQREIKNIHKDWGGNALNVISKFKIRDFNYKTRPDYDRTLGFIIDEIPKEIGEYALSGQERNAVNTYTLHGLSFKGLQEVKTKLDVQEGELDWQSAKIILLEKRIMELEGRLN